MIFREREDIGLDSINTHQINSESAYDSIKNFRRLKFFLTDQSKIIVEN